MINLFEYQNKVNIQSSMEGLEGFLDEIWANREKSVYQYGNSNDRIESQRFLQFIHKTNQLKSNKYVGVIHYNDNKINLLPKIFYDEEKEYNVNDINQIQNHILWWLSYCRKIKFPNYQASLSSSKSDFFEVLIYLFSKYTRALFNSSIYQQYEEVNRELSFIKGRLNTNKYITQNLSKGRWHKLNCTFDAFVLDNEFNRIIKFVTTLLFKVTKSNDNKKNLREILFILDEVTDTRATAEQCAGITFNPMFSQFETVRDYCQLFLSNSISFDYKNDLKLFAFLLPMEYVFEDFIFGFLNQEIERLFVKSQTGNSMKYLDNNSSFRLKPDLWIKTMHKSIIADTKYKIIYSNEADPKKGISQTDLYQMLAYAVRFNVSEIVLFYPNTLKQHQEHYAHLQIVDEFAGGKVIDIFAYQLPIINRSLFDKELNPNFSLNQLFKETKDELKRRLEGILTS